MATVIGTLYILEDRDATWLAYPPTHRIEERIDESVDVHLYPRISAVNVSYTAP